MRLGSAITYDVKLQYRHGFYYAYLVVCLLYVFLIRSLPPAVRPTVTTLVVFTDPSMLGFFFLGGIVLLERGQNTLEALFITPLRVHEYLWSKVISLTILAVLSSFAIVVLATGFSFQLGWLLIGVVLTSVLFVLIGFTLASFARSVNHYLIYSPAYVIIFMLPVLRYLELLRHPLFYLLPTTASLRLIDAAFGSISWGEAALCCAVLLLWCGIAYRWAYRWFYRYVVLRTGSAQ